MGFQVSQLDIGYHGHPRTVSRSPRDPLRHSAAAPLFYGQTPDRHLFSSEPAPRSPVAISIQLSGEPRRFENAMVTVVTFPSWPAVSGRGRMGTQAEQAIARLIKVRSLAPTCPIPLEGRQNRLPRQKSTGWRNTPTQPKRSVPQAFL